MKILLAHNSLYYPSHGGGDKSNRLLMEALALRGHDVRVVARVEKLGEEGHKQLLRELSSRDVNTEVFEAGVRFRLKGVDVHVVSRTPNLRSYFTGQIESFSPDVIVTSTDDPGQILFDVAARSTAHVVHLVRATIAVPFGPDASAPSVSKAELLRHADAIVGVSEYVAGYVREFGKMDAEHVPISLMEPGAAPYIGRFENPFVTIVNPCAVKGIDIFVPLAESMPGVEFAAVPSWGTTDQDIERLRSLPNVTLREPVDNIDELLMETRVLLVPSLWAEARSRMIVEAMSRGVPVIASCIGGIVEAKLGIDYLLPVNPITKYRPALNERLVPVAEVPPQDIEPWKRALETLTQNRTHYESLSLASREAALQYIENLNVLPFERILQDVLARPKKTPPPRGEHQLTPEKRKLLALLAKQRAAVKGSAWLAWFQDPKASPVRLICFPHAGGGTSPFRAWRFMDVATGAIRLPGRETRLEDPAVDDMRDLIARLMDEIHLEPPFAFYGQSMGAAVAFEFARELHRNHMTLPVGLFAAAARAPQFRLNHTPPPEPSDAEFLEELRRLDGIPAEVLDQPELLQLILPALRADARLYRKYVYEPGAALPVPIFAYGGDLDPNVKPEHVAAWREQTSSRFVHRQFRGGHFFPHSDAHEFLIELAADLGSLLR